MASCAVTKGYNWLPCEHIARVDLVDWSISNHPFFLTILVSEMNSVACMSVAATEATPGECRGIAALMISAYSRQLFHGNLVLLRQVIFLGIRHTHTHTLHARRRRSVGRLARDYDSSPEYIGGSATIGPLWPINSHVVEDITSHGHARPPGQQ